MIYHKWLQIGLKTILLLVLFISCVFAAVARHLSYYKRQSAHIRPLVELGGIADPRERVGSALVKALTHYDYSDVVSIHLDGTDVGDDDLSHLSDITTLQHLYLVGTPVTSDGIRHIPHLDLRTLHINFTAVDDSAFSDLARMKQLTTLFAGYTHITDKARQSLVDLPHLVELDVKRTRIVGPGLRWLPENLEILNLAHTLVDDNSIKHLCRLNRLAAGCNSPSAIMQLPQVVNLLHIIMPALS